MQKCGNCGHENRAGVVFCENCGASLIGKQPLSTKALDVAPGNQSSDSAIPSPLSAIVQEMAIFKPGDILKLSVEGTTKPIELQPKGEVILGRRDPATGTTPDVDLTPFAGYRMGVSRRHAAIRQSDDNTLNVWDLGSSNGTFLNGQRLNAHRPYPLRDGDELRLGQMVIRVNFKPAPVTVAEPASAPPTPLPSTRPLQPLPESAAPAVPPAASPKPVTEVVPAAPAPVTATQPPAEKTAPTSPAAAEVPKPAVSAPEATAAPMSTAPAGERAVPSAPAAEQPAAPAAPTVPVAAEQPAAAKPEAAQPAPAAAPPQATQPESAVGSATPPAAPADQEKAPKPPTTEQGSEPGEGENKATPPES